MKKFYDVHMHAMDISHANLTAFVNRLLDKVDLDLTQWKDQGTFRYFRKFLGRRIREWVGNIHIGPKKRGTSEKEKLPEKIERILNLVAYMENSVNLNFLTLEYYLKHHDPVVSHDNKFKINGEAYHKIVLCPLIQDFGYRSSSGQTYFYHLPPHKPVGDQVRDLLNAVHTYFNNTMVVDTKVTPNKVKLNKIEHPDPDTRLFEIYPFMGINPAHYTLPKIKEMFTKYFRDFTKDEKPEERQRRLYEKMGKAEFSTAGSLDQEDLCANIFAGIKLYPPLGFNPWPRDCPPESKTPEDNRKWDEEHEKVTYIYETCLEKNIPITTHCSDGGFTVHPDYKSLTDPGNHWVRVLETYPELKINFAHFGASNRVWRDTIIRHIEKEGSNVFADISCAADHDEYYQELNQCIKNSSNPDKLLGRILFGTDFMINLIWTESYNKYLKIFMHTNHISYQKVNYCSENPERFLFGGVLES